MKQCIFVYGTLRKRASHHRNLHDAQWLANAWVKGVLYSMGWYPAMVLTENGETKVRGEIYLIDEKTLAELDDYEGDQYQRVRIVAEDDHGCTHQAWIWEARTIADQPIILSGDWLQQ